MDAILTAVPWSGLGWGGLIFAAFLMVIRGDLVPRRTQFTLVREDTSGALIVAYQAYAFNQ